MSMVRTLSIPSFGQWFTHFRMRVGQWVMGNSNVSKDCSGVSSKSGQVLLVGAGPGDPGLLTVHAMNAIQSADVVLIDYLVSDAIVNTIPASTEQRYVGKRAGHHSMSQSAICDLMVDYAQQGKFVVRLKGGDPSIFGRTAEEANALEIAGIEYAVVPGITSASAASAYSGIPLTLRDHAQSVRLITAHLRDPAKMPNWGELVTALHNETIVFYMGLNRLDVIVSHMCAAGMSGSMPMAVIDKASTPEQQVCSGTASSIVSAVEQRAFTGPSLIVIGEAVAHQYALSADVLQSLAMGRD